MQDTTSAESLAQEFDVLMRRAGVSAPDARRAVVLAAYADLRTQIALLHGRYAHTDEPATVFRLAPAEDT
jgi:hypothetical protein